MPVPMRALAGASLAVLGALLTQNAAAQTRDPRFETVIVNANRPRADLPARIEGIAAADAAIQVNGVNTEDMIKYLPSLFVRKRHNGDTQDPIATRTSGVGASARSLIYADGILLSSLIGNNNTSASPRWGLAAPHDVTRIDVMYGPFAAQYAGNSIGAVVNITTRMPEEFEFYADATGAVQKFTQYGTSDTYGTWQVAGGVGDRMGNFTWRLSANHMDSRGQPLSYATLAQPASTSNTGAVTIGAFSDVNRTGAPIVVIGATGLEHQVQDTDTLKLAYEFPDFATITYTASVFFQDNDGSAQTYLRSAAGAPIHAGNVNLNGYAYSIAASAFSNNVYNQSQAHLAQGLALKSAAGGDFQWEAIASSYNYLTDAQRVPTVALPAASEGGTGAITRLAGTGWHTFDARGTWRGFAGHEIALGFHRDQVMFAQDRFNTTDWITGSAGSLATRARGRTAANAVWAQDVWTILPELKATLGARWEDWRAYDGLNYSASPALNTQQPEIAGQYVSPKASLAWMPADAWTFTASYGTAYRMPTVTELYQAVTTGAVLTVPNPNLKPERANSHELAGQYAVGDGRVRLSLFEEVVNNALISQSAPLLVSQPTTLFSYVQNIDRVRSRGIEFVAEQNNVLLEGLQLSGTFTFVDARIEKNGVLPTGPATIGKRLPQVPQWRANLVATYRPPALEGRLALTAGARYSDRTFGTIDNSDTITHTFQGFEGFFVVDVRAHYRVDENWSISAGIDNINNDKYFIFHPFPQRTLVMGIHYAQ